MEVSLKILNSGLILKTFTHEDIILLLDSFFTESSMVIVCVNALRPNQQCFSHVRMISCLPGLN